jgi:short-subunit dehydrogenase
MNVAVIGATSAIGCEIAAAFSSVNDLALFGRDAGRLREVSDRCREGGAVGVQSFCMDLKEGAAGMLEAIGNWPVDILVNAASATSRLRDDQIAPQRMREFTEVEIAAPLDLVTALCTRQPGRLPRIVYISTLLAIIASPGRSIYGQLKGLHESCLIRLQTQYPGLKVTVVRICKVLPPDRTTAETAKLGRAVKRGFEKQKKAIYFGTGGRALVWLYYLQPMLFSLAIRARRRAVAPPKVS